MFNYLILELLCLGACAGRGQNCCSSALWALLNSALAGLSVRCALIGSAERPPMTHQALNSGWGGFMFNKMTFCLTGGLNGKGINDEATSTQD